MSPHTAVEQIFKLSNFWKDLPWWLRGLSVCLQCGRPRFDPWVGKIPWRRKWQPTPVFLPGKSHGWRSLVAYSPQGRTETRLSDFIFTSLSRGGFPGSTVVKKSSHQCMRWGFSLWVRKIPWRRKWQPNLIFFDGKISWTEEPGGWQSMGLQRIGQFWATE